jgi:hypothetical protein
MQMMHTNNSSESPYKLLLTILRGYDLPIGDLTTSDPFVVIKLNGKLIGQTKVIYANHRTPEWNEGFFCPVQHVGQKVLLEVFDEDLVTAPDLLGTVTINLRDLTIGKLETIVFPLKNAGKFKSEGSITVSVLFARREGTISIVPVFSQQQQTNLSSKDHAAFDSVQLLHRDCLWQETHEILKTTFRNFGLETQSHQITLPFWRDLLGDVLSLSHPMYKTSHKNTWISKYSVPSFKRIKSRFVYSSKLLLDSGLYCRHAPIESNSIQLNLSPDDAQFILLTLPNRFCMWTWCQWIKLGNDLVNGRVKTNALPDWVSSIQSESLFTPLVTVTFSTGKIVREPLRFSLNAPHEVIIGEDLVSLVTLSSLVFACDSVQPKGYTLEVDFSLNHDTHERDSNASRPSIVDYFSNVGGSVQQNSLLIVQCRDESARMNCNDSHTSWFIDFSAEELQSHTLSSNLIGGRGALARGGGGESQKRGELTPAMLQPAAPSGKLAIDIFVLQGSEGAEKVIGQGKLFLENLLQKSGESSQWNNFNFVDENILEVPTTKECLLDKSIGKYGCVLVFI